MDRTMREQTAIRFESIESAHDYVAVLRETIDDACADIRTDTDAARAISGAERRVEALLLVDCKLNQLRRHVLSSLVILNDLRTLRRLLLDERK